MKQKRKGFTLIELLVCILIIGVLAGIAIPQYKYSVAKAKFSQLKIAVRAIQDAQRRYMLANNKVRSLDLSALDVAIEGCSYNKQGDKINCDWGRCGISGDSTRSMIGCTINEPYIIYYVSFSNNTKNCCASKASGNIGKKICQNEFPKSTGVPADTWCDKGGTRYQGY